MLILRILNFIASYTPLADPPESIESGFYGNPPQVTWWLKQSVIYFMALFGMKSMVLFAIRLLPVVVQIGDWALRWTEGNAAVQIFFAMLLFPVTMNAIQYYIIDTLIKKPASCHQYTPARDNEGDVIDAMVDDDRHRRSAFLAALDDSDTSDSDDYGKLGSSDEEPRHSSVLISSRESSGQYYQSSPANRTIPAVNTSSPSDIVNNNSGPGDIAHSQSVKMTTHRIEHTD